MGILEETYYEILSSELAVGDLLLLCTDGIKERKNGAGEMFGEERLMNVLASMVDKDADAVKTAICEVVDSFRGDVPMRDDMTYVVLRRVLYCQTP